MVWYQAGNKPYAEPGIIQLTDTYMHPHGPFLLTWMNFNPSIDKLLPTYKVWDEITYHIQCSMMQQTIYCQFSCKYCLVDYC